MSKHKLKPAQEYLLWGWVQPERNTVWLEQKLFSKLNGLKLTPEQQSLMDSGIQMDQGALGTTKPSQPFKNLQRHLIASIGTQMQANTVLLTNVEHMVDHKFNLRWVLATSHKPALMPREESNLLNLDL